MGMIEFEDRDDEGREMLIDHLEGRYAWEHRGQPAAFVPIAIALGMAAQTLACMFWFR